MRDLDKYVEGILSGDRMALSKCITLVESKLEEDMDLGQAILEKCLPNTGKSIRLGITGVPGVGKSTFIEALGNYIIREDKRSVAVLAIDPSSEKTKGSILGDKTRMNELSQNTNAFVRPSPASGVLGGVAGSTREAILLCEAAGFDTIFVETVGVGQSETVVSQMVDFLLLLLLPGAGDELQGMKRGIVETADLIAVNKADGESLQAAKLAQAEYAQALHLFLPAPDGWQPQVLTCSSLNSEGITEIWKNITECHQSRITIGFFDNKRKEQSKYWFSELVRELIIKDLNSAGFKERFSRIEKQVLDEGVNPYTAAKDLLSHYRKLTS